MATSIFLTYARSDGDDFSRELADALRRRREGFTVIRDRDEHYAGLDWQDWVEASIKGSDVLLFVMTRKSVKSRPCKNEWRLAQEHDIRVIPLLVHRVTRPMGLGDAHYIDFTGDQEVGFRELIANLRHLQEEQPRHRLRVFEAEYAAAERDLEQGGPRLEERRARKDVDWARERVEQQQRVADDPQGVRRSIDAEITQDLSDKRPPGSSARRLKVRSVNEPPHVPDSFRDRRPATTDLLNQLRSDAVRLVVVVVVGREGIGKSALVGRVMTAVAKGEQLDDARLDVSGLVYLKTTGLKPFSVSTMLSDLGSLLDEDAFDRLKVLLESPGVLPPVKLMALLAELGDQRVIVLIDNFEQLVDPDTWELRDDDQFSAVLTGLMQLQSHKVKIILTTQRLPKLSLEHPGMLGFIDLDHQGGLPSPYAEEALKALDRDGSAGLRDAPDHLLAKAQELTKGHPKALEALHLLLMTSREVSLEEIVSDPDPPHEVADAWIGKAFGRLGREEQRVLQALAIYGLPVSAAAVDYLLRDHLDGPAAPVLGRLARMRLVLKRPDQLYELVLVGRQWVLDTILAGEPADRDEIPAPFTRAALLHHGAEYFARKQPPDDRCLRLEDLTYHLAEIDLRTLGGDDRAVDLLVRVGKFLFRLGQAERVLKLLKPLEEQLTHPLLRIPLLIMGGRAYRRLGDHERAIGRYQQALRLAEEQDDRWNQAVALTNLGGCYYLLGQAREAGDHYQAARAAAQRAGNRTEQLAALSGHCLCLLDEGHFAEAARLGQQALDEVFQDDDEQSAQQLFNLGLVEVELGRHQAAMERFETGRQLAGRVGYRYGVGRCQQGKAEVLLDHGDIRGAIALAEEAVGIGDQIEDPTLIRDANHVLALACLQADAMGADGQFLEAARTAAETACRFRVGNRAYGYFAALGVIAIRQGSSKDAVDAFREAESLVRRTLHHGARTYDALDARGLALSGLALLRRDRDSKEPEVDPALTVALSLLGLELADAQDLRRQATEAYRQARAIADAPGVTGRVRRLLDALPDPDGFLAGVKRVATRGAARTDRQRRRDPKLSA